MFRKILSNTKNHLTPLTSLTLLVALLATPAVAGAATTSTTVNSAIGSVISVFTSSGTVNVNVTPTGSGAQTIASDTLTVSTNDALGYTLQISDSDTNTNLVSGGNNVPASSATQGTPVAQTVNTWGYRVDSIGGFGAGPTSGQNSAAVSGSIKFAGVPSSAAPNTIKTTATTASNDTTTVWYGVAANTSQPSGTYSDTITYTATAN
jgi:hypothetical protein